MPGRIPLVKKLLLTLIAAAGGFLAYRKVAQAKAEQDLWNEATDPLR